MHAVALLPVSVGGYLPYPEAKKLSAFWRLRAA